MKGKRLIAIAVAICVLFSVLFSVIFPSAQADHVHESEETCPICATILECSELLRALSAAVLSSEDEAAPCRRSLRAGERTRRALSVRPSTLVSLKIKLSD